MNWSNFQTHNDAPTKAFEMLCNQLFENWCKEEYSSLISSFAVVNGAGGDGGVESYAVLIDGGVIGLQAKWFPNSITSSQFGQIKSSIKTAMKNRPQIKRYIVCVPRDLASTKANSEVPEDKRWKEMVCTLAADYPEVIIELWNENRILKELQRESSAGILKFWFEKEEISEDGIRFSFEKSKQSWLYTKYVPELNTFGVISKRILFALGDSQVNEQLYEKFSSLCILCERLNNASDELLSICGEKDPQMILILNELKANAHQIHCETRKILSWLAHESTMSFKYDEEIFWNDFDLVATRLKESPLAHSYYFHFHEVTKVLSLLSNMRLDELSRQASILIDSRPIIFLGEPGTGKTHGISAVSDALLTLGVHLPILIPASSIDSSSNWRKLLISNLGLSDTWSEEEIWQGLSSLANRKRFCPMVHASKATVLPKVIVCVDAIDEAVFYDKWITLIQETTVITNKYPTIRFCFLSRPFVFAQKRNDKKLNVNFVRLNPGGDVPVHKLFDQYIEKYDIDISNAGWIKYALTTPLALKLFCEINRGKTIQYHSGADLSVTILLKKKISLMEKEYCRADNNSTTAEQYIFRTIMFLSNLFSSEPTIEHTRLINEIVQVMNVDVVRSQKIVTFLLEYGILHRYCVQGSGLLSPDVYCYSPGIQGYFDYVSALMILDSYTNPQNIDFSKHKNLQRDALYMLAIISAQRYGCLITNNHTIDAIIDSNFKQELAYFALRHMAPIEAEAYKSVLLNEMSMNAESVRNITNQVVLPLARISHHPLGTVLLHEFLSGFERPAQRDALWSVFFYLKNSVGENWHTDGSLEIEQQAYCLVDSDTADGLPLVYAWALSTVHNKDRQKYRVALMRWALVVPSEFYNLFLKFAHINDPQIRSDMYAILMSLLFEVEKPELLKTAAEWLMKNILAPERINTNRDVAIRHYSTSIVRKALWHNLIDPQAAAESLPPFSSGSLDIALSEENLDVTYMGDYDDLSYDLGRYVLVDHITSTLPDYHCAAEKQYECLIEKIAMNSPKLAGVNPYQFIISVAHAFIHNCGWKHELRGTITNGTYKRGLDGAIVSTYGSKTHGAQSDVMTLCEKYVWQARAYILGFLSDHLKCVEGDNAFSVSDYGLLDDFVIPSMEIGVIDPEQVNDLYPWHLPEQETVLIPDGIAMKDELIRAIQTAPDVSWEKWIQLENSEGKYPIQCQTLLALYSSSNFESPSGMVTDLYICTILVDIDHLENFMNAIINNSEVSNDVMIASRWKGGVYSDCYITPKEICWMPWKKRYDSTNTAFFSGMGILSAVDKCTYNFQSYGDVIYDFPSAPIRELLGITNTDGYKFYGQNGAIKALSVSVGEKYHTQQYQLLAGYDILELAKKRNKSLVWIMQENRWRSGKAREKYGDFRTTKEKSYVGFFENDQFIVKEIPYRERNNSEEEKNYFDLIKQYGYAIDEENIEITDAISEDDNDYLL